MSHEMKDAAYLWDMLDAARTINDFVANCVFDEYSNNRMLRGAVERNLEIIGEAAGKVSSEFRNSHPQIPWRQIIGQRNIIIHEYGEIDNELIWKVSKQHIPDLIAELKNLIPPDPTE